MSDLLPPRTHNMPPVVAPADTALLADLRVRYPEVEATVDELEKAFATYPEKLTLEDEETAAALQDLLGKAAKTKNRFKADRGSEKRPWDTLVKVVQNFFGKAEEKIDGMIDLWKPRYQAFLDLKEIENRRRAEEQAEAQRKEAERLATEAAAAEERARAAREAEEAARRREEAARAAAEEAERRRREAESRAAAATEAEARIAREKRERDKAEREANAEALRAIRRNMRDVERLHALAEADEASDDEAVQLDVLSRPGGAVSLLAGPVASSTLLDDEQRAEVEAVRERLAAIRKALGARLDAKERRRREAERKKAEAAEAAAAEDRRKAREAEDARLEAARQERERIERETEDAKVRERAARGDIREARAEQRGALAEQKGAGREAKALAKDADRAENRADRLDRKIETSTDADFNRTRGDLGTVGSTTGRWAYAIVDDAALRTICGPLGEHFTEDALAGAVYRWMVAHRSGFIGERIDGALPGVLFTWERDVAIRA
jgi:hypothetical protein